MSDNPVLLAEERTEFGKGSARRARRAGKVPTVLYGHGAEPRHLDVPGHDLFLIVRGNKNALVELKIEGKTQLALVKDVQVHPVRRDILHADFLAVKAGEKVDVEVPVVVVGEPVPGTVHAVEEFTILVKAPATAIPEHLEVSIEGVEAGTALHVADLQLPAGVEVELDPETVVVSVQEAAEEAEEDAEAAAESAAPAEGDAE
ncbi:50S ribosomal protein L25/general stress protein Ctc [Actinomyces bouchesdurhonensis]|uniref:50S ribosomal protein L25/general stress protein Ctc n=1 Tax=Actinomyces bouchesdurhonensis TaxID=1852361 RepID=UPI003C77A868